MKPILFSGPMVRAILEGRKTQTRRVMKPQPPDKMLATEKSRTLLAAVAAPYKPGDILYVREKWCNINKPGISPEYYYFAETKYAEDYDSTEWKWRPSIHMPRAAARLFLRVTDVRVERVQEIGELDAIAEGFQEIYPGEEINEFIKLWDTLNAKRGYGWAANPWVWVYTFERTDPPGVREATP